MFVLLSGRGEPPHPWEILVHFFGSSVDDHKGDAAPEPVATRYEEWLVSTAFIVRLLRREYNGTYVPPILRRVKGGY
jgi:hypothetical protein